MLVKDGNVGSRTRSSKPFTDGGRNTVISRRSVRASNEQVVFARGNLTD